MKVYILFSDSYSVPEKVFEHLYWEIPTYEQLRDYGYSEQEAKEWSKPCETGWGCYYIEVFEKPEIEIEARPMYKDVIDYLNQVTGSAFRYAKAHQRVIEARVKEKFTLDDFKKVIDTKSAQWKGTNMQTYLRPSTLFQASKMDGYLQESRMTIPKSNDEKTTAERARETVSKFFNGN